MSTDHPITFFDIPGYPGYKVASDWTVWTFKHFVGVGKSRVITDVGRPLKVAIDQDGYFRATLFINGKHKCEFVHNLVLFIFKGPRPSGCECRHLDGTKTNNNPSNLEWGTSQENANDRHRHGTVLYGDGHPRAKLRVKDIPQIRKMIADGITDEKIGKSYGVGENAIFRIRRGMTWGHVE